LIFVLLTVLLDLFDYSLPFVILAHFEHLAVVGFDSLHQILKVFLSLLALGHKKVPYNVCKLLVIVELGHKKVLFYLFLTLFLSRWVVTINEEIFNRKNQDFAQNSVSNYHFKNIFTLIVT
jgi:hypothetical protein